MISPSAHRGCNDGPKGNDELKIDQKVFLFYLTKTYTPLVIVVKGGLQEI